MWNVLNRTPFPVFSGFDRDQDGKSFWLVWLKATFRMRHERSCLFVSEQVELFREPLYRGSSESTDLLAENEICFPKSRPDVLLTGYSLAPRQHEDDEPLEVSASIGEWEKSVLILPEMRWSDQLKPEPCGSGSGAVLLGFRNAFGGIDMETDPNLRQEFGENPIGQGFWSSRDAARGKPLPRILAPNGTIEAWDCQPRPVSFACVPKERPRRARYGGTYDEMWMRRKSPLLPDDFDPRYWQCVDEDQQLAGTPPSGTRIVLTNMSVEDEDSTDGAFVSELPHLDFESHTRFKGKWQETEMQLQTVHLLPTQALVTLTYCGALPVLAAANDVCIETTEINLRGHSGFRVHTQDAERFDPATEILT